MARRHHQPAWLLPGFVGAILFGVSIAGLLSVLDLIGTVQSLQVSGAETLGVRAATVGREPEWRTGLQAVAVASGVLGLKYSFIVGERRPRLGCLG